MSINRKQKFVSGVAWEGIGRLLSLGIQFLVTVIIARVLSPSDYGVIGLLTVFTTLGSIILDSGFSQALIQKKEATNEDLSTIFFVNIFMGGILYICLFLLSPLIADFYEIPELTKYARLLFLIIPINSFGIIQNVKIQKELQFRESSIAIILSSIISGGIGIYLAYNGYGIMTLVLYTIIMYSINTLLLIIFKRWRPDLLFSYKSLKELFPFSMNLLSVSILTVLFNNIYTLIIGKYFSIKDVGYYNQAKKMEDVSSTMFTTVILKVSFPTLVEYKHNLELLKESYRKIISMTTLVVSFTMSLLMCVSYPLFDILFTEKWLPSVPYFNLLCLYGLILPLHQININIFKVLKKGKKIFMIELFRRCMLIITILVTVNLSINIMLIGQFVCMIIVVFVNMYFSGKLIDYSISDQINDVIWYYILSLLIAIFVFYLIPINGSPYYLLLMRAITFITLYILIGLSVKMKLILEIKEMLYHSIKKLF